MKVLVTGAAGFVDRHVVAQLLERGHDVIAVVRDATTARNFTWFDRVRFIACDIHGPIDSPVERLGRPDAVIHLAWSGLPSCDALFHLPFCPRPRWPNSAPTICCFCRGT